MIIYWILINLIYFQN